MVVASSTKFLSIFRAKLFTGSFQVSDIGPLWRGIKYLLWNWHKYTHVHRMQYRGIQ